MGIIKRQYDTIDGRMIGYQASGVQKDFLTDALGSVTAEVDQSCTKTFDGRYKPYGGDLSSSGQRGKFGWVGAWGYREMGLLGSSHYVRARHYSKTSGFWLTQDSLWPKTKSFVYSKCSPITLRDPSGKIPIVSGSCEGSITRASECCKSFTDFFFGSGRLNNNLLQSITDCVNRKNDQWKLPVSSIREIINARNKMCNEEGIKSDVCFICPSPSELPAGCNPCTPGNGAVEITPFPDGLVDPRPIAGCPKDIRNPYDPCDKLHNPTTCGCTVVMCQQVWPGNNICSAMFHEMLHCSGVGGPKGHGERPPKDIFSAIGCCICEAQRGSGSSDCYECKGFK